MSRRAQTLGWVFVSLIATECGSSGHHEALTQLPDGGLDGDAHDDSAVEAEAMDDADSANMPEADADGASDAEVGSDLCAAACATTDALGCPGDTPGFCIAHCTPFLSNPTCGAAYGQILSCAATQSASEIHCNASGNAVLNDDACTAEKQAFANCLLSGA
jgi:hypothetical protein